MEKFKSTGRRTDDLKHFGDEIYKMYNMLYELKSDWEDYSKRVAPSLFKPKVKKRTVKILKDKGIPVTHKPVEFIEEDD